MIVIRIFSLLIACLFGKNDQADEGVIGDMYHIVEEGENGL